MIEFDKDERREDIIDDASFPVESFACRLVTAAKKVLIYRTFVFNEDNTRRRTANDLSLRECIDVHPERMEREEDVSLDRP